MNSSLKTTLAVCLLGSAPAFGATQIGKYVQVGGFGTLGVAQTDSSEYEYIRQGQAGGVRDSLDFNLDSNLGLQGTVQPASWISGTVQLLARHHAESNITADIEWAFVKLEPIARLELRGGRMQLPMFAISDFRNVSYANTWARAPDEVYGLALLERLEGVDATYRLPVGSTSLALTLLSGKSFFYDQAGGSRTDVSHVRGANLQWEIDGVTLRIGQVRADVELGAVDLSDFSTARSDPYTFSGVGISVDRDRIVAQAEYVTRRSENFPQLVDSDGWYVLGGYRFGRVLPYVSLADTEPKHESSMVLAGRQTTTAAGVRWDAFSTAAFKLQVQQVDTHGTRGISFVAYDNSSSTLSAGRPVTSRVNVASLSIDFVF